MVCPKENACLFSTFSCQTFGLSDDFVNVANHVESNFREVIVFALKDFLESRDGFCNGAELTGVAGENLSDLGIKASISVCIE